MINVPPRLISCASAAVANSVARPPVMSAAVA
jgi:hypothetical protein